MISPFANGWPACGSHAQRVRQAAAESAKSVIKGDAIEADLDWIAVLSRVSVSIVDWSTGCHKHVSLCRFSPTAYVESVLR